LQEQENIAVGSQADLFVISYLTAGNTAFTLCLAKVVWSLSATDSY